jgi:hypothetical protein
MTTTYLVELHFHSGYRMADKAIHSLIKKKVLYSAKIETKVQGRANQGGGV